MTEIYVIRHVEAEGNLYRMMQGRWDGGVTDMGRMQKDALAERFKDIHIDALYSSDLFRAKFTATAITKYHDLKMNIEPRFAELDAGPWEGQPVGNLMRDHGQQLKNFIHSPEDYKVEGSETFWDVRARSMEALYEVAEKHDGQVVAITSHGAAIRCMLTGILGMSLNDVEALPIFNNTGVARLFYEDGKFRADYINDHSHLDSLPPQINNKTNTLSHIWTDPREHGEYYLACYKDAWLSAHGSLKGFDGETYFAAAIDHYKADPQSVAIIYKRDEPVGLLDMDSSRGSHAGYGWISLLYLKEEYRNQSLGIQLLGRAIVKYQAMGRQTLRLHAADDNKAALAFYRKYGFRLLSEERGLHGKLLLMERRLRSEDYGTL